MYISSYGPQVYPKIRSKCKICCESYFETEQLKFDNGLGHCFNFEQLYGWNGFRTYLKVSGTTPQSGHGRL